MNINDIRDWFAGTKAEIGAQRAELARLQERRDALQTLPRPREELVEIMHARIDAIARSYLPALAAAVDPYARHPLRDAEINALSRAPLLTAPAKGAQGASLHSMEAAMFFLFNAEMKAAAEKAIMAMPYAARVGPRQADRIAEIEQLDGNIALVEARIKAIEGELKSALRDEEEA